MDSRSRCVLFFFFIIPLKSSRRLAYLIRRGWYPRTRRPPNIHHPDVIIGNSLPHSHPPPKKVNIINPINNNNNNNKWTSWDRKIPLSYNQPTSLVKPRNDCRVLIDAFSLESPKRIPVRRRRDGTDRTGPGRTERRGRGRRDDVAWRLRWRGSQLGSASEGILGNAAPVTRVHANATFGRGRMEKRWKWRTFRCCQSRRISYSPISTHAPPVFFINKRFFIFRRYSGNIYIIGGSLASNSNVYYDDVVWSFVIEWFWGTCQTSFVKKLFDYLSINFM